MYCCDDWCNDGVLLAVPGVEVLKCRYGKEVAM